MLFYAKIIFTDNSSVMLDVLLLPNPFTIIEFDFVQFCWLQLNVSHLPRKSTIGHKEFETNSSFRVK